MDASAGSWLSDLALQETEDCNLFQQCYLNLLDVDDDEETLSHDIVARALHGQPLSSENHSSYSEILSNSTNFERPTKQPKTNNCTWNILSPSSSSPTSQVLSFHNANSSPTNNKNSHFYGLVSALNSKQNNGVSVSPRQTKKSKSEKQTIEIESPKRQRRDKSHSRDHIMAERKRREKLSQSLIALAALIPGLKKLDKASVLGDAIKYVKELQERLRSLEEEQNKNREVAMVNKPQLSSDDHSPSRDRDDGFDDDSDREKQRLPRVEARVSEKDVLLRIHCQKQKGLFLKILVEIQSFHLFVVTSSVLPFGDSTLDITVVAQMGTGYNLAINDLVKSLRVVTVKSMS